MKNFKLFPINLYLFSAGEGTDMGSDTPASGKAEDEEIGARESGNRRRTKSESTVIYGKQIPSKEEGADNKPPQKILSAEKSEDSDVSLDEQFEDMIRGDFKEAYNKKVQSHIKHRLGDVKKIEAENKDMKAVIDVLAQKYGSEKPSDILQKLEEDRSLWEDAASEAGLTVEQYRKMKGLERDNIRLREEERARDRFIEAQKIYNGWLSEAETVSEYYPGFNLEEEIKNPDFRGLIQNNIPMKKAYETVHLNEIVQGVSEFSAKRAEENAVIKIQNRKARPKENITSSSAGVVIKDDPSSLTAKDREEIIRRAQRGEIITF